MSAVFSRNVSVNLNWDRHFDDVLNRYFQDVKKECEEVLENKDSSFSLRNYLPSLPHFTYVDNSWDWSSHTTHIHQSNEKTDKDKEKDNPRQFLWTGVIISVISAIAMGFMSSNDEKLSKNREANQAALTTINQRDLPTGHTRRLIVEAKINYDDSKHKRSIDYRLGVITILAAGILLTLGAVLKSNKAVMGGQIGAFTGVVYSCYQIARHWSDASKEKKLLEEIKHLFDLPSPPSSVPPAYADQPAYVPVEPFAPPPYVPVEPSAPPAYKL
ncbi:MAG: hypothetical protein ACOVOR_04865 [Rhabdochlamydiaceae bacterium]